MKKIGIVGGSGFTGGELIRILLNHPKFKIKFIYLGIIQTGIGFIL